MTGTKRSEFVRVEWTETTTYTMVMPRATYYALPDRARLGHFNEGEFLKKEFEAGRLSHMRTDIERTPVEMESWGEDE